jgi:hypothetical protein
MGHSNRTECTIHRRLDSGRDNRGTRVRFSRMHPIGVAARRMRIHLAAVERRGSTPLIERSPTGAGRDAEQNGGA